MIIFMLKVGNIIKIYARSVLICSGYLFVLFIECGPLCSYQMDAHNFKILFQFHLVYQITKKLPRIGEHNTIQNRETRFFVEVISTISW